MEKRGVLHDITKVVFGGVPPEKQQLKGLPKGTLIVNKVLRSRRHASGIDLRRRGSIRSACKRRGYHPKSDDALTTHGFRPLIKRKVLYRFVFPRGVKKGCEVEMVHRHTAPAAIAFYWRSGMPERAVLVACHFSGKPFKEMEEELQKVFSTPRDEDGYPLEQEEEMSKKFGSETRLSHSSRSKFPKSKAYGKTTRKRFKRLRRYTSVSGMRFISMSKDEKKAFLKGVYDSWPEPPCPWEFFLRVAREALTKYVKNWKNTGGMLLVVAKQCWDRGSEPWRGGLIKRCLTSVTAWTDICASHKQVIEAFNRFARRNGARRDPVVVDSRRDRLVKSQGRNQEEIVQISFGDLSDSSIMRFLATVSPRGYELFCKECEV
jgi:hypothetical protein